ncbi:hypothetical protein SUGI_0217810 [Cryptomeria japonica]|uniref:sister chromatid cohesion protein PDS5 homolog A isoform X2 n=1 Tax=Cryptomeria japonica TaxID=3369 RepID=UPI0024089FF3|nr:sister chromatid cohesion protein PDS5 homolog A isoform X2 [Cryptomeria japonica]GLJ13664.1 hypothetical protein SUGI_0217810 [Cryptomeria japonica]
MEHILFEIERMLGDPPLSEKSLVNILQEAAGCLFKVEQSPSAAVLTTIKTLGHALIRPDIFQRDDRDVRLLVVACISEIMRITAPDTPYSDDVLREIFQQMVAIFHELHNINNISFSRIVAILETVAKVRSCVLMLDLQCDELILKMFNMFFSIAREDHPDSVLALMETIMISVLDESEIISEQLLFALLSRLRRANRERCPAAYRIAGNVVKCLAGKLKLNVHLFLTSLMSPERKSERNLYNDYDEIIFGIYKCAPEMLESLIPHLTQFLLTEQLDVRLNYVNLVGRLLSIPCPLSEEFQPLVSEFLKRFGDKAVDVRLAVVEHGKKCLLSNPFRPDAPYIIAALGERLLDFEEAVRKNVVAAICDVAKCNLKAIPSDTIRQVADCLHDKIVSVRIYSLDKLTELYKVYCSNCSGDYVSSFELDWIPGEVLRSCSEKDFRPQTDELDFFESIYPSDLPLAERVKRWIASFSQLEKAEVKALGKILAQKQSFQLKMKSFLSSCRKMKEDNSAELQIKICSCFRKMSGSFEDPAKAEESFLNLFQINNDNIWKDLSSLLDPGLSFINAQSMRDDLLEQLGERHPLYEFMKILTARCSYLLFGKEHVREILNEISSNKLAGNDNIVLSSMNLLVFFAGIFPSTIEGSEKDLLQLLENDDDQIKEGVVCILSKTGRIIDKNMFEISGSTDFLLKNLCLEDSTKQAKDAEKAITETIRDSGLHALSALYKRLVVMLENGDHLPKVLQLLGCIAQIAMPVFETEEERIIQFICRKLLHKSSNPADLCKTEWEDRSEICFLKLCGIKTLVKSYLPNKDAQLRKRIKALFGVLTRLISAGEISEDVKSSKVDKAHLRLAAAIAVLRLSMQWDSCVSPQLFHLTLRTAQDVCPYVRKQFLVKVHQYLKNKNLESKYACAFILITPVATKHEILETRQYFAEFIKTIHQETQLSQLCSNSYEDSLANMLSYLIHTLAHHPDFPVSDYGPRGEAFEPFYQQLHFFLSVVLQQDQSRQCDPKEVKELNSIPLFMTIFRTIKILEDTVEKSKSENLYILCDLGLLITKDLTDKEGNVGKCTMSVSFPSYYRTSEGSEDVHLKVDGSHLPPCLVGDDVLRHFKSATLFPEADKDCGNAYENAAKCQYGNSKVQFLKNTRRKGAKQSRNDCIPGETICPEMLKEQLDYSSETQKKSVVLSKFKDYKQIKNSESKKDFEQFKEQPKNKILEMVPSKFKSADDNVVMCVGEVSDIPKRRRGRPKKGVANKVSQGKRQIVVGKDNNGLKISQAKLRRETIDGYKEDVEKGTGSLDSKLVRSESVHNDLSKIALLHQSRTEGCFKSLGKRSISERRIVLSDLTTVESERLSQGILGGELGPMQLVEHMGSGQSSAKDSKKRLISIQDNNEVAEAPVSPKRKRDCLSKVTTDLISDGSRQGLAGMDPKMLKVSQPNQKHERSSDYKSDVQRKTELPDSKLFASETTQYCISETAFISLNVLDTYKMKQDQYNKDSSELPYSDQQQDPSESFSKGLESPHHRQGVPKELGERSNSKGKIKLPDLKTVSIERVLDGFLGSELNLTNMQLKEIKGSMHKLPKSIKSKLDASHKNNSEKMIANEGKTAETNVMTVIAEALVSSKRKRDQLSKRAVVDFTSQDTREGLSGMDSKSLKLSQHKQEHQRSLRCKTDVVKNKKLAHSKLENSRIAADDISLITSIPNSDEQIERDKSSLQRSSMCQNKLNSKISMNAKHKDVWKSSEERPGQFIVACHNNVSKTMRSLNNSILENAPSEVKSVDDNIIMSVAEVQFPPKRKRGRPRKRTEDLRHLGNTQGLTGKDSNGLRTSQPMQSNQKSLVYNPGFQKETELPDLKLVASEVSYICKTKEDHSREELTGLHSTDQEQGTLERSPTGSGLSHCRRGRRKGSGKRFNFKGKTKSADLKKVTAQRVLEEILEVELAPSNGKPKENKGSEQILTKDLKKRSGASRDKSSKTMDMFQLGSPKVSTKFQSPSSKRKNVSLKKEIHRNQLKSEKKRLQKNEYNLSGVPRKHFNKKNTSRIEESTGSKFEEKDEGGDLLGQRIKVWWPLDKKFYVGFVDSYDNKQKKHKIIYDDGDVEMLRLRKEQWERIDGSSIPTKVSKTY